MGWQAVFFRRLPDGPVHDAADIRLQQLFQRFLAQRVQRAEADRPILIDRFLNHALECEADAISDGTHAFVPAVMEHIELAGIHSGDSACIIPSVHITP